MFMKPMLMTERQLPFDDDRYLFEPLIEGQRLQLSFIDNKARLLMAYNNDVSRLYPELLNVPAVRPSDFVLDGEVAYVDPVTGEFDYQTLLERRRLNKAPMIRDAKRQKPVRFFVFDVLYYNGEDLRRKPLAERKLILHHIMENNAHYHRLAYVDGAGKSLFENAERLGFKGIACKRKDSLYEEGRSGSWIKVKAPLDKDLHTPRSYRARSNEIAASVYSFR